MSETTIHVVFHAHLDPVWMWPWTAGLDEALATSRSACDRLDRHPELFYTQGEAWTLAMVERTDPALFARIQAHVAAGRWELVNGWWTQPDCNFPSEDGLRQQIRVGQAYVRERFGVTTRCGFNPDSFGHCAKLPEILREHGQDRYVFMRPQDHECALPARYFRWRTRPGGPAVTAFRIADSYCNGLQPEIWMGPVRRCVEALPAGAAHTMLFLGVGDHGGGPTERLVEWVKQNPQIVPGARLEFSTVNRFFDAVERERLPLPDVVGELQFHAIGCYTVVRATKQALRRAEHALARAGAVAGPEDAARLRESWQAVAAHQFHDTLGGSSIPDAYRFVEDQLGGAAAVGDELLAFALRRQLAALPDDELPRLVFANPGTQAFDGWHDGVVYLEGVWTQAWRLLDPAGHEVAFQPLHSGAGIDPGWVWGLRRVLVRSAIPAGGLRVVRLDRSQPRAALDSRVTAQADRLANDVGLSVAPVGGADPVLRLGGAACPVALHLIEDPSDTWSHGIDRYAAAAAATAAWEPATVLDEGPFMASARQRGVIGNSTLLAEWRVYAGERWAELRLEVAWAEQHRLLKLVLPSGGAAARTDGTPGMGLTRANDGSERPLHDWTRLGDGLAVVCPDVYALDATPERVRFTLLRSPYMAHHGPCGEFPRAVVADQGTHVFRFRIHLVAPGAEALAGEALSWHRPPLVVELTRGMPARWTEY